MQLLHKLEYHCVVCTSKREWKHNNINDRSAEKCPVWLHKNKSKKTSRWISKQLYRAASFKARISNFYFILLFVASLLFRRIFMTSHMTLSSASYIFVWENLLKHGILFFKKYGITKNENFTYFVEEIYERKWAITSYDENLLELKD